MSLQLLWSSLPLLKLLIYLQRGPGLPPWAVGVPTTLIVKVCAFLEPDQAPAADVSLAVLATPTFQTSTLPMVAFKNLVSRKLFSVNVAEVVAPSASVPKLLGLAMLSNAPSSTESIATTY